MQQQPLINRIIWIALFTTPVLGIFGATPGFLMRHVSLPMVIASFVFITFFVLIIWIMNIGLLVLAERKGILRSNALRLLLSMLVSIGIACIFFVATRPTKPMAPDFPHFMKDDIPLRFIIMPVMQGLAINLMIFTLIELLRLQYVKQKVDRENEQLKIANMQARINSFMEQLNPHFLFNSLSTLRSLIIRSPANAEVYLEQLSHLLRFSTTNTSPLVSLAAEVEFCTNYLHMQKVRFGDSLDFSITIVEDILATKMVPVYSLQQLTENAIKHNVLTKEKPLFIRIYYNAFQNEITVLNNIQPKEQLEVPSGSGLANLNERSRLLGYGELRIDKSDSSFSVSIKLNRDESSDN